MMMDDFVDMKYLATLKAFLKLDNTFHIEYLADLIKIT